MICSSVNIDRFIRPFLPWSGLYVLLEEFQGVRSRPFTCIPSKSNRKIQIDDDKAHYRQRHKIENMFGRLKGWRSVHTRYDRYAHTFMSPISVATTVIF